ncbi:MAG: ribonuclease P protein component [Granulosicoccus sp.]|nr:ribonuclease P protein component [Granulosicoccus sp.]
MAQFGRQYRILKGSHYRTVFDNRLRFHSRFFSFHLKPNPESYARLGIAVSKKVSKLAVQRNRIKRQIRDSFRHYVSEKAEGENTLDYVVVAKGICADADNREIRRDLDGAWQAAAQRSKKPVCSGRR